MEEFKAILKKEGVTGKEFAERLGFNYDSYRSLVNRGTPTWAKAFVIGYNLGKINEIEVNDPETL